MAGFSEIGSLFLVDVGYQMTFKNNMSLDLFLGVASITLSSPDLTTGVPALVFRVGVGWGFAL